MIEKDISQYLSLEQRARNVKIMIWRTVLKS